MFGQRTSKGIARCFLVFWVLIENTLFVFVEHNSKLENSDPNEYFTKGEYECQPAHAKKFNVIYQGNAY